VSEEIADKLAEFREKGVSRVKLGLTDIDGVIRGKYVSLTKFEGLMRKGGGFCDCILGWDVNDVLYDNVDFTGWHTGFPDAKIRLLVETERWSEEDNCPFFLGEFVSDDEKSPHPICPRTRLKTLLERAKSCGLDYKMGFEYEFFVFSENSHSVREKNYSDLRPLTPGNFGYSVLRASSQSELFGALMDHCEELRFPLEAIHCETGPGVWEAALAASPALEAADRANLFKTYCKAFFQKRDLMATFMAKWHMDYPGQSGHCHFSISDLDGESVFAKEAGVMTQRMRYAIGGLQKYLPDLIALLAPTINSYTRLVKGAWAPTASTWGVENRTVAIRAIPGSVSAQRIECRAGGADANPYLTAAAIVGASLLGIEEKIVPDAAIEGNAYGVQDTLPDGMKFPTTLRVAAERLSNSEVARNILGDAFVEHFAASRIWESREYERHVNSWQLERYFEII
jgi:glutamine synthetase